MAHDLANLFHLKVLNTVLTKLCNDYHFCSRGLKMLAELEIETWLKVGWGMNTTVRTGFTSFLVYTMYLSSDALKTDFI